MVWETGCRQAAAGSAGAVGNRQQQENHGRHGEERGDEIHGGREPAKLVQRSGDYGGAGGHQESGECHDPQPGGGDLAAHYVEYGGGQDGLVGIEEQSEQGDGDGKHDAAIEHHQGQRHQTGPNQPGDEDLLAAEPVRQVSGAGFRHQANGDEQPDVETAVPLGQAQVVVEV